MKVTSSQQIVETTMLQLACVVMLTLGLLGCEKQPPPCNEFQFRKSLEEEYVTLLKDRDRMNLLNLEKVQAVLTNVYIKSQALGSSTCKAILSFSDGKKKLQDNIGSNHDKRNIEFEEGVMSASSIYSSEQILIFDYLRRRHAVEFTVSRADGNDNFHFEVRMDLDKKD